MMDKNYAWDKNYTRNENFYLWNGIKSHLDFYMPNPFITPLSLLPDNTKSNELKITIKKNPIKFNFNL